MSTLFTERKWKNHDNQGSLEHMSNVFVSTVPADGLAPCWVWGTLQTDDQCHVLYIIYIYIYIHTLEGLKIQAEMIDRARKSHNASDKYHIMHHFVTEMCTRVHISVTKWCIVGYGIGALWDLCTRSIHTAHREYVETTMITKWHVVKLVCQNLEQIRHGCSFGPSSHHCSRSCPST